jgi:hypothetical protein
MMTTLEIIRLRMAGEEVEELLTLIRNSAAKTDPQRELMVYQRQGLGTDLAIHIRGQGSQEEAEASELGKRLASILRIYGLVDHSVWVECTGPSGPKG